MNYVTYYLLAGFVLAVIADGFNMWKEQTTGVPKPETRFGLAPVMGRRETTASGLMAVSWVSFVMV